MANSANSGSKSKRSVGSMSGTPGNSNNSNKKTKTNQKTLGMSWGSNSRSSSRSSFRSSPFSDFGSYMVVKNRKLQDQFEAGASTFSHEPSSSGKPIFNGVSIFVDGYTVPSSQELKAYMLKHGGRFENYFSRRRVTHIICSNLPDSKIKNLRSFSRGLPVVKPTWVLDCVAANKLLTWLPYELEQLASETCRQPKLSAFFTSRVSSASGDEATCVTDRSLESRRRMDSNLLEEGGSAEYSQHYSEQSSDSVRGNCIEKGVVLVDQSLVGVQPESCSSPPPDSVSSYCVHDKITKESSNSTVLGPFNQRHSTLVDPNFVENYFKNSRLHFIGTWRNRYRKRFPNVSNGFKSLNANPDPFAISQKANIIHIDMDCFFVSVVIRNRPELRDKPVAVCHSDNPRGTAEISSANYPARDFGIKAGIFVRDAKALCPHLVILPYNFEAYEEVADQFYDILHKHCDKVQAVSCDESFIDVTNSDEDPEVLASIIRKEIFEITGCTASAGIAGNMLMARLATRTAKPNGQCYIPPDKVHDYLNGLPIKSLPGIGRVLEEKLKSRQVKTCGELRTISKESLQKDFGSKTGDMLWNYSRGIDNRLVGAFQESKSVGAEVNWGVRFNDLKDCQHFLVNLCKEVSLRLQGCGVQGRTFTLKVKKRRNDAGEPVKYMGCGDCENLSHSTTVPVATDEMDVLQRIASQLFGYFHIDVKDIRGMGLQVSKLESADVANQGNKRNSIRSWLVSASASTIEDCKISSPGSGEQSDERSQGELNLSSRVTPLNQDTNLPPLHDLDMGVIESLPPELFSEINNMYGGKLLSLISKNKGKSVVGVDCLEGFTSEGNGPHLVPSVEIRTDDVYSEANQLTTTGKVELAQDSGAGPSNLGISDPVDERIDLMPSSLSQVDGSVLQQLPEEVRADILELLPPHRAMIPESTNTVLATTSRQNDDPSGLSGPSRSNELWVGNPPGWVDEFEKSNYWILNIFADMYYQSGSSSRLSYILLRTISASQFPVGATTDDGWDEAFSCFCEFVRQYVKLKVKTDLEEIYDSFRLLKRLATKSTFLLQVFNAVLPELQETVVENYGGTFNIS